MPLESDFDLHTDLKPRWKVLSHTPHLRYMELDSDSDPCSETPTYLYQHAIPAVIRSKDPLLLGTMSDCDCDLDCGDIDCGECLCLCCCDDGGGDACCYGGYSSSSGHRSNSSSKNCSSYRCWCWCCFLLIILAAIMFIITLSVRPVHVAVEDASLARFALAGPNGTALAYDVSLVIAVRNRNWAMRAKPGAGAPLDADLLFAGTTFAHVRLLQGNSRGIRPGKAELYHVATSGESVQLGTAGLTEFVKESAAGGVFQLELKLVGDVRYPPHRDVQRLEVTCPLELPLSSATAVARFTKVKCV